MMQSVYRLLLLLHKLAIRALVWGHDTITGSKQGQPGAGGQSGDRARGRWAAPLGGRGLRVGMPAAR
jgi:hypothetical protein